MKSAEQPLCPGSNRMVVPGPYPGPPRYFCCTCGTELQAYDLRNDGGTKGAGWLARPHTSPWWRPPVGVARTPADGQGEGEEG